MLAKLVEIVIGVIVFLLIALYLLPWIAIPMPWLLLVKIIIGLLAIIWLLSLLGVYTFTLPWRKP